MSGRQYRHKAQGHLVPSVTSIIPDLYDGVPPTQLVLAQERGIWIHRATALWDQDNLDESQVPADYRPYLEAYKLATRELQFVHSQDWIERPLYSKALQYAGTLDRVSVMGTARKLTVLDIKTGDTASSAQKAVWGLQTAGYWMLWKEATQGKMPGKDPARAALLLRPDGSYRLVPLEDPQDFPAFRAFLAVKKWRQLHGIGGSG